MAEDRTEIMAFTGTLVGIGIATSLPPYILTDSSRRNPDPQFQFQLVGNPLLAPGNIVSRHGANEFADIMGAAAGGRKVSTCTARTTGIPFGASG